MGGKGPGRGGGSAGEGRWTGSHSGRLPGPLDIPLFGPPHPLIGKPWPPRVTHLIHAASPLQWDATKTHLGQAPSEFFFAFSPTEARETKQNEDKKGI